MSTTEKNRNRLITLLKELFQLDQPELDFGLYKIMHAKSEQITTFLQSDLLKEIEAAFGEVDQQHAAEAKANYEAAIEQAKKFGAPNPDETPGVQEAKSAYENAKDSGNAENEIYDHLYRFFERYYDSGDFMSRRYYARESDSRAAPYSVPYDGREVYLHWANKDQYYIKSTEYLSNYSFELNAAIRQEAQKTKGAGLEAFATLEDETELKVHFRIIEASEGEHGNIKAASDQKRFFHIHKQAPILLENGELVIQFHYRSDTEKTGQDNKWQEKLLEQAEFAILNALKEEASANDFIQGLQRPAPTDSKAKRTLLGKYLYQYSARNTMDYFIHKDLGGFMRRELDFYIKNEIMRLDDIDNADVPKVEQYLAQIRVLRRIAQQLIAFLAQLEDFQKKLWLKKKFVTETNYCITLDRVPEEFYAEIAANDKQRDEWEKLFVISEIKDNILASQPASQPASQKCTPEFLKNNPFLLLDTALFPNDFKERLLAEIPDLDAQCDGVLIHSENFQALELMQQKYREQVECIYIDPPYNTGSDGFVYKDSYLHSSWLQLIEGRIIKAKNLMSSDSYFFGHIDYIESSKFNLILDEVFGSDKSFPSIAVKTATPAGFKVVNPGPVNVTEVIHCYSKNRKELNNLYIESGYQSDYNKVILNIKDDHTSWIVKPINEMIYENLGVASKKELDEKHGKKISQILIQEQKAKYALTNSTSVFATYGPHKPSKNMKDGINTSKKNPDKIIAVDREDGGQHFLLNGRLIAFYSSKLKNIDGINVPSQHLTDFWNDISWDSLSNEGGVTLKNGKKPLKLLKRIINLSFKNNNGISLDFFAGSGTTGHAIVDLNRYDGGERKYILVEMGNYFDTVLKPRIQKVVYSKDWKDGKPVSRVGISHCFKTLRLESYEDTLNNLALKTDANRDIALANNPDLQRDYLLNYFIDVETQTSQSLLNIADFRNPTAYKMSIKKPGSEEQSLQAIDLIETFNWLIGLWVSLKKLILTY